MMERAVDRMVAQGAGLLDLIGDLDVRVVLVCGSRDWTDYAPVKEAIELFAHELPAPTILHGGARGADGLAESVANRLGIPTRAELADWVGKGHAAGPDRNRRMLELGPDLVLAFKDDGEWDGLAPGSRGGTEHMCRIAITAGVLTLRWSHDHGWERLGPEPEQDKRDRR